ncbi:papain-like cysteine peptidase [Caballeronia sp. LjRoot31]
MARLAGLSEDTARVFDSVVSLGTHCYTGTFLKRFQLKKFSSAFDWIFSNPSMIAHAIDDDFETFLDAAQYSPVPIEQRRDGTDVNRVQHLYYKQAHGVDFMFNHHDVHEPKDYAYLTRCVERFRDALRDNAKTLFLLLRRENEHSVQEFELIRDSLQRKNKDVSFMFVAVANTPTHTGIARMDVLARDQNAILSRFAGTSHWQTLDFVDPFDEFCLLRAILSNFLPISR